MKLGPGLDTCFLNHYCLTPQMRHQAVGPVCCTKYDHINNPENLSFREGVPPSVDWYGRQQIATHGVM